MDVQSRRDGCGLYELAQFMLDVPERYLSSGAERRGVRRCLPVISPGELTTSGGPA